MKLPKDIERVVRGFQKLYGVGRKTAERYAFDLISHWNKEAIEDLSGALLDIARCSDRCISCKMPLQTDISCIFCIEERKKRRIIAVVSSLRDLYSLESLQIFNGTYFLLHTMLSPIDKRGISNDIMNDLFQRIEQENIEEVFLAFDNSPEGEATSFYIAEALKQKKEVHNLKITSFATGVPVGSSLDYLDMSTLGRAFVNRVLHTIN